MSEETAATPQPWVLDVSVLTAIARDDPGAVEFVLNVDGQGRALVLPALALAAASLAASPSGGAKSLHGVAHLANAIVAPLLDFGQAVALASVITATGLDPWDAHVAANASSCPVVTFDAAKWGQHASDLGKPLSVIEIRDPDED